MHEVDLAIEEKFLAGGKRKPAEGESGMRIKAADDSQLSQRLACWDQTHRNHEASREYCLLLPV